MADWRVAPPPVPTVRVLGVGAGGCEAVERMSRLGVDGAFFVGLEVRAPSAADARRVPRLVAGSDLLFVVVRGGDTHAATLAATVARGARDGGSTVVLLATEPFAFEGATRERAAALDVAALERLPDALLVLPQERLLAIFPMPPSREVAVGLADAALRRVVVAVTDLAVRPVLVGIDAEDVRFVLSRPGRVRTGHGSGRGARRAGRALRAALADPLLGRGTLGAANGLLVNLSIPPDFLLDEWTAVASAVHASTPAATPVVIGCTRAPAGEKGLGVSIVATGLDP